MDNDLHQELDRGTVSLLVLLDLSVAFNTINDGILLAQRGKNSEVGAGELLLNTLAAGLGSVLSSVVFSIYMKLLGEIL